MTQLSVTANELHEQAMADFKVSERFAYNFIMKVKRIRDERLYKELGFSSFENYCESAWNVKRGYMDDRILVADSFGEDFDRTCGQLGHKKSLLLARMEPEVRKQIEASNNVDALTVKKLQEAESHIKEAERRAAAAEAQTETLRSTANHWETKWRQEASKPPQIQTKEVIPDHVTREIESLKQRLETTQNLQKAYEKDSKEYQELKNQIGFLNREKDDLHRQIESATAISGLVVEIDNMLKTKLAPMKYSRVMERLDSDVAIRNMTEILSNVRSWLDEMEGLIPKRNRKVIDYDPAS